MRPGTAAISRLDSPPGIRRSKPMSRSSSRTARMRWSTGSTLSTLQLRDERMRGARTLGELSQGEVQLVAALADMGRDPVSVVHPAPSSNVDDPEHQVVLTEVQDDTETIIIADILAVAINKSLIEVVEFGLCRSIT
jgi:hypothetical protein